MGDQKSIRVIKRVSREPEREIDRKTDSDVMAYQDPVMVIKGWIEEFRENQRRRTLAAVKLLGTR